MNMFFSLQENMLRIVVKSLLFCWEPVEGKEEYKNSKGW
jgi:hypothetical protein